MKTPKKLVPILAALAVLSLAGCTPQGPPAAPAAPAELTAEDNAAIEATLNDFVAGILAGDMAAVAATYMEDAMLLPPNHPAVEGKANIQAFFETFPPVTEFTAHDVEIFGQGDTAYIRGVYTMTMTPEGAEPILDEGKFMEVRKKQADGSWLYYRDMYSSDLPAE